MDKSTVAPRNKKRQASGTNLVRVIDKIPVVSTLDMWEGLGVDHKALIDLVKKYEDLFQEIRILTFEKRVTGKKGNPQIYCYLDEEQATFLITLMKNSEPVVNFKHRLTREFYRMKKEILRLQSIVAANRSDPEWIADRTAGKGVHRCLADSIKLLVEHALTQGSEHAKMYFTSIPNMINKALFIISPQVKTVRDALDVNQLKYLSTAEYIAETTIQGELAMDNHYKQVYPKVKTKVETFAAKIGRTPVPNTTLTHAPSLELIGGPQG